MSKDVFQDGSYSLSVLHNVLPTHCVHAVIVFFKALSHFYFYVLMSFYACHFVG